jgi:hypothetical protein
VAFIIKPLNAIAHRLYKTVDQGGLNGRTRRTHDAPSANGASVKILQKEAFVFCALVFRFHRCQSTRYPAVDVIHTGLVGLKVLF